VFFLRDDEGNQFSLEVSIEKVHKKTLDAVTPSQPLANN
jgi:hypothetical protein